MSSTDKLPLGFRGSVTINQCGKMAENCISLINARPRLNAGLEKTPGQNCRILNKRRGRLIEKVRYFFRCPCPDFFHRKVRVTLLAEPFFCLLDFGVKKKTKGGSARRVGTCRFNSQDASKKRKKKIKTNEKILSTKDRNRLRTVSLNRLVSGSNWFLFWQNRNKISQTETLS